MLNQQTLEKLTRMQLNGMAEAFRQQQEDTAIAGLSFEERFGLLVDQQWSWKEESRPGAAAGQGALQARGGGGGHRLSATPRLGSQARAQPRCGSRWVRQHHNVFLLGPTGIGKSLSGLRPGAEGLPRRLHRALHRRAATVPRSGRGPRRRQSGPRCLQRLARMDVLVVDDLAMAPLNEAERRDFLEICDDRYQRRSTILTSQLPVAKWHAQIGDPTIADSILDRLVHNAHRIELQGESMRKKRAGKTASDEEAQA